MSLLAFAARQSGGGSIGTMTYSFLLIAMEKPHDRIRLRHF